MPVTHLSDPPDGTTELSKTKISVALTLSQSILVTAIRRKISSKILMFMTNK